MTIRTLAQRKLAAGKEYGLTMDSVWDEKTYFPLDEYGTGKIFLLRGTDDLVAPKWDFIDSGAVTQGNPKNIQTSGNFNHAVTSISATESWVFFYVLTNPAVSSWGQAKLGDATVQGGSITVAPGTTGNEAIGLVEYSDISSDDVGGTTTLGGGNVACCVAMVLDAQGNTLSLYEGELGSPLVQVNQIVPQGLSLTFSSNTYFELGNTAPFSKWGIGLLKTKSGVALPSTILEDIATTRDDWYNGQLGLNSIRS